MKRPLSILTPLSVLLMIVALFAVAGSGDPESEPVRRPPKIEAAPIRAAVAPAPTAEQADLLGLLHEARTAGDTDAAAELETQYALALGRDPAAPVRLPAPDVRVTYHGDAPPDKWQGLDLPVAATGDDDFFPDIAADGAGNLYVAVEIFGAFTPEERSAYIYRSVDGGDTWAVLYSFTAASDFTDLSLIVCEGNQNWLMMAYVFGGTDIVVFRESLDTPGTFDQTTVASYVTGVSDPTLATDCDEFAAWYPYLIWHTRDVDAWGVQFTRSTDYGATWQAPWIIHMHCGYPDEFFDASQGVSDLDFGNGRLLMAFDGYSTPCVESQSDVFFMSSSNFGTTWSPPTALASSSEDEYGPSLAAAKSSDPYTVVVAYTQEYDFGSDLGVEFRYSLDRGDHWSDPLYLMSYIDILEMDVDLAFSRASGRVHAVWSFQNWLVYYASAPFDAPETLAWAGDDISFVSQSTRIYYPVVSVDPTRAPESEAIVAWIDERNLQTTGYDVYFDAPFTEGLGQIEVDTEPIPGDWYLRNYTGTEEMSGTGDALSPPLEEGEYTITFYETGDWTPLCDTPITAILSESAPLLFACEYDYIPPRLASVADVGNDQGRRLRLVWERSAYDAPGIGTDITGYDVLRRQDANKLAGWDWLDWVPARGDDTYQYVAESLCDSTAEGGICWTVFMIRATTADPFTHYASPPDSGWSVDNLAPNAPLNFAVAYGAANALSWDPSEDEDFRYFKIYRGTEPGFAIDPDAPAHTTVDTDWTDPNAGHGAHYLISCVDFAGNESEAVPPATATGASAPRRLALFGNAPNPFNPATTIAYELPTNGPATLRIYDASGRQVRTLFDDRVRPAGRGEAAWDGRDDAGRTVPAGVYVYRLSSAADAVSGRMTLVK